jgi:hypothetical protein
MSPSEIRAHLTLLELERRAAESEGVNSAAYMTDLQEEVAEYRRAWVVATITEIASLRGAFYGRSVG